MDRHGYVQCTPRRPDDGVEEEPLIDFTSGYVQRALHMLPKQGSERPWKLYQNYLLDWLTFRFGRVDDGTMVFEKKVETAAASEAATAVGEA